MKSKTDPKPDHYNGSKMFRQQGTCSKTFHYILNQEFKTPNTLAERATDPLAGGIMQLGHQCGMLWGASLAVGAESYRRFPDLNHAKVVAIHATQALMESFDKQEETVDCRDITHCDFSNNWSHAKYMLTGRFLHCFRMASKWAPEAIETAHKALNIGEIEPCPTKLKLVGEERCRNCASEVARKMGATEEQQVMVAGFAGGLGLSGNACGALSAAIWMNTQKWCKEYPDKKPFKNAYAEETLKRFQDLMGHKIACVEISEERFESIGKHSVYMENGGCGELLDLLAI